MLVGRVCITANLSNLGKCTNKNLQFVLILQSSHSVIFLNIAVLKNLERLIVRICWSLSFNNVWDFRTATLLKRYSTIDASCEIQESVITVIPYKTCESLLLDLRNESLRSWGVLQRNAGALNSYYTIVFHNPKLIQKHELIRNIIHLLDENFRP